MSDHVTRATGPHLYRCNWDRNQHKCSPECTAFGREMLVEGCRSVALPAHLPERNDDVVRWLRRMRDAYPEGDTSSRGVVDRLLDRYRECADYGLTLRPAHDDAGDP